MNFFPKLLPSCLRPKSLWRGKAVVLCSTWLDSSELHQLAQAAPPLAPLARFPASTKPATWWRATGSPYAKPRSLVEDRDRRAIAIERPLKPFYLAALTCTGTLLFTLLLAASEALHRAGIPALLSGNILDRQLAKTFRSFLRGGRNAYPAVRELSPQLRALRSVNSSLADYIEQSAELAAQLVEKR